jgi:hypothetical protein
MREGGHAGDPHVHRLELLKLWRYRAQAVGHLQDTERYYCNTCNNKKNQGFSITCGKKHEN